MENTLATESAQFTSGLVNPGFRNKVRALQINPFVKVGGLEVFGVLEQARGKANTEATERTWHQVAADVVYRFGATEPLFVGARYNRADGDLAGIAGNVGAKRVEVGGGWFITPSVLAKATYVKQTYFGYPAANIKNGGEFKGLMLEGVIAF
jgi:hypothetical protein